MGVMRSWQLIVDDCPFDLLQAPKILVSMITTMVGYKYLLQTQPNPSTVTWLDMVDTVSISATISPADKDISFAVLNPSLLNIESRSSVEHSDAASIKRLDLTISLRDDSNGVALLQLRAEQATLKCHTIGSVFRVIARCPPYKTVEFVLPYNITREQFLFSNPLSPLDSTELVQVQGTLGLRFRVRDSRV